MIGRFFLEGYIRNWCASANLTEWFWQGYWPLLPACVKKTEQRRSFLRFINRQPWRYDTWR